MSFALIVKLLLILSIFLTIFSLSLRARHVDWFYLFRNSGDGLRALIAMYLIVPVFAVCVALNFDLDPAVKIAMVALSLSPIPPLLPGKQLKVGSEPDYVTGLLVGAAIASLVVAPLASLLIDLFVPRHIGLSPARILPPLLLTVGFPLVAGRIVGAFLKPETAQSAGNIIAKGAMGLLIGCALILLYFLGSSIWTLLGNGTLLALLSMIIVGLVAGYLLAGKPEHRAPLALAASTRHPGVAIAIAATHFPDEKLAPAAIVLFVLVNAVVGLSLLKQLMAFSDKRQTAP